MLGTQGGTGHGLCPPILVGEPKWKHGFDANVQKRENLKRSQQSDPTL